jgi:biotin carboxyl carrier protein
MVAMALVPSEVCRPIYGTGYARATAPPERGGLERAGDRCYYTPHSIHTAEAVVEATRQSTVSAQTTGRIVELRYDVGDVVQKGQVIARIDQTELAQVVAGSEAQVAQAKAAYENTRVEAERTRDLARQKFVSQAALDRAEAALRIADAQLKAAKAGAGQATTSRGYTTIIAPYTGVVSARHVELGEMAAPGKPLLTGFDPADLRVVATVPQYKIGEVRTSPRASVEIPRSVAWCPEHRSRCCPPPTAQPFDPCANRPSRDVNGIYPGCLRARAFHGRTRAASSSCRRGRDPPQRGHGRVRRRAGRP